MARPNLAPGFDFTHPEIGVTIKKGQRVISPNLNSHIGFGGGEHYCIGANLDIAAVSAPQRLRSGRLNGIRHRRIVYYDAAPRSEATCRATGDHGWR